MNKTLNIFCKILFFGLFFYPINLYADNLNKIFDFTSMSKSSEKFYNTILSNEEVMGKTNINSLMDILSDNPLGMVIDSDEPNAEDVVSTARDVLASTMLVFYFVENYRIVNNEPNAFSKEFNNIIEIVKGIYGDLINSKVINCSEKQYIDTYNQDYTLLVNSLYSKDFNNLLLDNKNIDIKYEQVNNTNNIKILSNRVWRCSNPNLDMVKDYMDFSFDFNTGIMGLKAHESTMTLPIDTPEIKTTFNIVRNVKNIVVISSDGKESVITILNDNKIDIGGILTCSPIK